MSIWEFCIKRPVFTTVLMFSLVLVGIMGYMRMGVDLMPDFDVPVVSVATTYIGADPEVMDQDVTDVIEEQVGTLEGIRSITSASYEGYATTTIEFELYRDIDVATQEVRDKVSIAERDLPDGIEKPIVQKIDPNAQPIIYLSLSGDVPYQRLSQIADLRLKNQIQNVGGVGSVYLYGFRERNVRIWLDHDAMDKYALGPMQVVQALGVWHVELPGGRIETKERESTIKMKGEYSSIDELANMVISWHNGSPVRLKNIARIEDGEEDVRSASRVNGKACITLAVVKQTGANSVGIAKEVIARLPEFRLNIPVGMDLDVTYDSTEFIEQSVEGVGHDLILGGIFTAIVIYMFLRHVKMTIISLISIPVSLLGTFGFMYFCGFTINQITMLAMSLAVGMVIDDTIVVLENIFRHMEEDHTLTSRKAAANGTGEVAFAVLAATMSIAAIFLPVAFMGGVIGRVFFQFGISIGIAICLSYTVSITLTPMLCGRWLKLEHHDNFIVNLFGKLLTGLDNLYRATLAVALKNRFTRVMVIIGAVVFFAFCLFLGSMVGQEFSPNADRSGFLIAISTPVGSSMEFTDDKSRKIAAIASSYPEVKRVMEMVGNTRTSEVDEATVVVQLVPRSKRTRSQQEIMDDMRAKCALVAGCKAFPSHFPSMGGGGQRQSDLTYVVQGQELDKLEEINRQLLDLINSNKRLADSDSDLELIQPQVQVYPRRDAAADVGVTTSDITSAVQIMMGGVDAAKFKVGSKRYDIRVKAEDSFRTNADSLRNIVLRTASGKEVKLMSVANVVESVGPKTVNRFDRMRSIKITANLASGSGWTTGQAGDWFEREAKKILVKYPGYTMTTTGMTKIQKESMQYMIFAMYSAVVIVYLVLAAQFESFIHPFTIMMTVPLALGGALIGLFVCNQNLSVFALIGMIMLIGIVTRNGILLVEFAVQLRDEGLTPPEAMLKAGPLRLRPILMTALSTIIGVVPVALGLSEGGEVRAAMGVAVIGGMLISTFLTLFIVPVAYITFDGILERTLKLLSFFGFKPHNDREDEEDKSSVDLKKVDEIRSGKVIKDSGDKE